MPIYDSASMASSYNKALKHPSKYKIYLHQDTFIIHQHFLHDMLHIFQSHQELGLLGVAGCKTLPPNGIWWESGQRMGKVIEYRGMLITRWILSTVMKTACLRPLTPLTAC